GSRPAAAPQPAAGRCEKPASASGDRAAARAASAADRRSRRAAAARARSPPRHGGAGESSFRAVPLTAIPEQDAAGIALDAGGEPAQPRDQLAGLADQIADFTQRLRA